MNPSILVIDFCTISPKSVPQFKNTKFIKFCIKDIKSKNQYFKAFFRFQKKEYFNIKNKNKFYLTTIRYL